MAVAAKPVTKISLWEAKAGRDYRYMMVFEHAPSKGVPRCLSRLVGVHAGNLGIRFAELPEHL